LIARLAFEKKAEDITILDMRKIVNFCDFFVIASGSVDRHIKAIADGIVEGNNKLGIKPSHMEGEREAKWILLDYGDCLVHIFQEDLRRFYDLEHLWQEAPKVSFKKK
jgi:ribosome-associated protein